jgi:hypothetical protein
VFNFSDRETSDKDSTSDEKRGGSIEEIKVFFLAYR